MPQLTHEITHEVEHEMAHEVHHDVSLFEHIFTEERIFGLSRALLVMLVACVVAALVRRAVAKLLTPRLPKEQAMLLERATTYTILGLAATWALREMGFEISVLLGAAGGVTLAVGFAAQTSVANIISGLFLIFEKPFGVGDSIDVSGVSGEVLAIDLLSIKLRTADYLYIRVPNQTVLGTSVVNNTRYALRAFTMSVWIDVGSDMKRAQACMVELAQKEPKCMSDRAVTVLVAGVDNRGVQINLTAWADRNDVALVKSQLFAAIGQRFKEEKIAWPPTPWAQRAL